MFYNFTNPTPHPDSLDRTLFRDLIAEVAQNKKFDIQEGRKLYCSVEESVMASFNLHVINELVKRINELTLELNDKELEALYQCYEFLRYLIEWDESYKKNTSLRQGLEREGFLDELINNQELSRIEENQNDDRIK